MLVLRPHGPGFANVLRKFSADPRLFVTDCGSTVEATAKARQLDWCFLFCYLDGEEELGKVVQMMKLLGPGLKRKHVRVVVLVATETDRAIESNLKFYGVTEVIFEPVAERALVFKLERHLRSQHQQMSREMAAAGDGEGRAAASSRDGKSAARDAGARENDRATSRGGGKRLIWAAPIELQSDFWLTTDAEAKEIMDRWLVRIHGPSHSCGRWVKVKDSGDPGVWQWVPQNPERDPFHKDSGSWYFRGQRPELQEETWLFSGPAPELLFGNDGKILARKFQVDSKGNLLMSRDSNAARALTPLVRDSFNVAGARSGKTERSASDDDDSDRPVQHRVRMAAPLTCLSDCWLIEGKKPRRVTSKWMIRIIGPGPAHGRWEPLAGRATGGDSGWKWTPLDPKNDPFTREPGSWTFTGQAPKFQEEHWILVGENPKLAFQWDSGDKPPAMKFHVAEHGVLQVSRDSAQAQAFFQDILNTFTAVIRGDESKESVEDLVAGEASEKSDAKPKDDEWSESEEAGSDSPAEAEVLEEKADDSGGGEEGDREGETLDFSRKRRGKGKAQAEGDGDFVGESGARADEERGDLEFASEAKSGELGGSFARESKDGELGGSFARESKDGELGGSFARESKDGELGGSFARESKDGEVGGSFARESKDGGLEGSFAQEPKDGALGGSFAQESKDGAAPGTLRSDAPMEVATDPSKPSLGAIALASLISELVMRRDTSGEMIARKYCDYLSKACAGIRTELWVRLAEGPWLCIGTNSGDKGRCALSELERCLAAEAPIAEPGFVGASVHGPSGARIGVLVVIGDRAEKVPTPWVAAAAQMTCGLAAVFERGGEKPATESAPARAA